MHKRVRDNFHCSYGHGGRVMGQGYACRYYGAVIELCSFRIGRQVHRNDREGGRYAEDACHRQRDPYPSKRWETEQRQELNNLNSHSLSYTNNACLTIPPWTNDQFWQCCPRRLASVLSDGNSEQTRAELREKILRFIALQLVCKWDSDIKS